MDNIAFKHKNDSFSKYRKQKLSFFKENDNTLNFKNHLVKNTNKGFENIPFKGVYTDELYDDYEERRMEELRQKFDELEWEYGGAKEKSQRQVELEKIYIIRPLLKINRFIEEQKNKKGLDKIPGYEEECKETSKLR